LTPNTERNIAWAVILIANLVIWWGIILAIQWLAGI